ncbi:MAG: hypothetical protein SFV18_20875 [Bryobacteraceae bacterium]|nr:hypothetical protein [Bryobacteraceae bacterium]
MNPPEPKIEIHAFGVPSLRVEFTVAPGAELQTFANGTAHTVQLSGTLAAGSPTFWEPGADQWSPVATVDPAAESGTVEIVATVGGTTIEYRLTVGSGGLFGPIPIIHCVDPELCGRG